MALRYRSIAIRQFSFAAPGPRTGRDEMSVLCCRAITCTVLAALTESMLAGCTLQSPVRVEVQKEVLSRMPGGLPREQTRPVTLLVLPVESAPIYDTTRIAYTTRLYEVGYFSEHEWAEKPARMLQTLLVRALLSTHAFSAIQTAPYVGSYTYALRLRILELMQDFTVRVAMLSLSLHVQLSDDKDRVIVSREISLREPMHQQSPYAGVLAANEAAAKALQEIVGLLLENAR